MNTKQFDQKEHSTKLRRLVDSEPTPENETYVNDLLNNKRDGVSLLAVYVLASWARAEDLEGIRTWYLKNKSKADVLNRFSSCLITTFSLFLNDTHRDWLVEEYYLHKNFRKTLSHVLRKDPDVDNIVAKLMNRGEEELTVSLVDDFMFSRSKYLKILIDLEGSSKSESIKKAAYLRLQLFNNHKDKYP